MRKISLIGFVMLIVSIPTFAGGLLTNTNQHAAFLRMLSRGARACVHGDVVLPLILTVFIPILPVWLSCRATVFIFL